MPEQDAEISQDKDETSVLEAGTETPEIAETPVVVPPVNLRASESVPFDPNNPPSAEMDCFGKYYEAGDPPCDGGGPRSLAPCQLRAECAIRTTSRLQAIAAAQQKETRASSGGGGGVSKASADPTLSPEELLAQLPQVAGLEIRPNSDNPNFISYYSNGKQIAEISVVHKTRLSFCCTFAFPGEESEDGGWHYNGQASKKTGCPPIAEFLPKIAEIMALYKA